MTPASLQSANDGTLPSSLSPEKRTLWPIPKSAFRPFHLHYLLFSSLHHHGWPESQSPTGNDYCSPHWSHIQRQTSSRPPLLTLPDTDAGQAATFHTVRFPRWNENTYSDFRPTSDRGPLHNWRVHWLRTYQRSVVCQPVPPHPSHHSTPRP